MTPCGSHDVTPASLLTGITLGCIRVDGLQVEGIQVGGEEGECAERMVVAGTEYHCED